MQKFLSVILLIFTSVLSWGKDSAALAKSDSLFAKGVELYDLKKYEEAIPFFEGSDRIDKAELDSTSNRRDYSAMWLASCYYKIGNEERAKELNNNYYMVPPIDRRLTIASDSILAIATDFYDNEDYLQALEKFKEVAEIEKSVLGENNFYYANALSNMATLSGDLDDYADAVKLETKAMNIRERILGKEHPDYAIFLNNLAFFYSELGKSEEAVRLGEEALNIGERIFGKEHPEYINTLNNLSCYYLELGYYKEALRHKNEVLKTTYKTGEIAPLDYILLLNELALQYCELGNYLEAVRLGKEALDTCEKIFDKEYPIFLFLLGIQADYNYNLGDYNEAIRLGTELMSIQKNYSDEMQLDYATTLHNLAKYYSALGNNERAVSLGAKAVNIREQILGKENSEYSIWLNDLANYYVGLDNYKEALKLWKESLNIIEHLSGLENLDYVHLLENQAESYFKLGDYKEAVLLGTRALNIFEKILGKENINYGILLNNVALYNLYLGDYKETIRMGIETMNILRCSTDKEDRNYVTFINNLAGYYSTLGDQTEAIKLGKEALNISERISGKDHPGYAILLNNLSCYYSDLGNHEEAIKFGNEALQIREEILGKEHPDYALSLNNLSCYYSDLGNHEEAIRLATEAANLREQILGRLHPDYAITLHILADFYSELGDYEEAVRLETEALNIRELKLGKEHPDYILSLYTLSVYNLWFGKKTEVIKLTEEIFPLISNNLRFTLSGLTAQERRNFWNKYKNYFEKEIIFYSYHTGSESLISNAYDATLLSKGILLSTEMELSSILQESGDDKVTELYDELRNTRLMLNQLYEKPKAERHMNTDSLERVANTLERELVQRSREYGDFTRNMSISWQDVQAKLKQKDLAVEFVSFPIQNDSIIYAAYVINRQMEAPKMVSLFEAKDLSKMDPGNYYVTTELSNLVWNNLDPYLKDAENVYFAPAGELYNIAIESLPDYNGEGLMSDFYNFYRLSSTRELAVAKAKNDYTQAALYGGMKFNTETSFLKKDMEKYPELRNRDFSLVNIADSLDLRDGAKDLPGTAVEVDNIERYLKKTSVRPLLYKGTAGTEASFKSLSGKKVNLMHLATHGFYWTETDVRRASDVSFLMLDDEHSARYYEDKALTRSGLLFSGANNALQGVALPEDVEDGVLTAKEIAGLDLRGLDMVVLSACQTGLGEITGDGVYGLQRGFKKAGANSLLMSLWKVDDEATQMLMTKFYEEFLGGKSKFEALKCAQKYLREYQPKGNNNNRPYSDPKYWAAFILLDALD